MHTRESIMAMRRNWKLVEYSLISLGAIPITLLLGPIAACFFVQGGLLVGSQVQLKIENEEGTRTYREAFAALLEDFQTRGNRPANEGLIQNFLQAKGLTTRDFYVGILAGRLLFVGLISVCLALVEKFYDIGHFQVDPGIIWLYSGGMCSLAFVTWLSSLFLRESEV